MWSFMIQGLACVCVNLVFVSGAARRHHYWVGEHLGGGIGGTCVCCNSCFQHISTPATSAVFHKFGTLVVRKLVCCSGYQHFVISGVWCAFDVDNLFPTSV